MTPIPLPDPVVRRRVVVPQPLCCGLTGVSAGHLGVARRVLRRTCGPCRRPCGRHPPTTLELADGFGCRTHFEQAGNGRTPVHLAQVLARDGTRGGAAPGQQERPSPIAAPCGGPGRGSARQAIPPAPRMISRGSDLCRPKASQQVSSPAVSSQVPVAMPVGRAVR